MAAKRRVVLRGTWLVKVSPSCSCCCILHCPGPGVACSLFCRSALHSLISPLPTDTLYQPSGPFTYRASASVPQPSAYEFCAPQLSAKRRKPPQSAASLRTSAAKISMLRAEIVLLGFHIISTLRSKLVRPLPDLPASRSIDLP